MGCECLSPLHVAVSISVSMQTQLSYSLNSESPLVFGVVLEHVEARHSRHATNYSILLISHRARSFSKHTASSSTTVTPLPLPTALSTV